MTAMAAKERCVGARERRNCPQQGARKRGNFQTRSEIYLLTQVKEGQDKKNIGIVQFIVMSRVGKKTTLPWNFFYRAAPQTSHI